MKKMFLITLIALVPFLSGCAQKNSVPEQKKPMPVSEEEKNPGNLVGNDQDENGCKSSAGYSWCESKNKCLRTWEEPCSSSTGEEIRNILAKKYNKDISEVKITITKEVGNYAGGSVLFGQGGLGEGGLFLAVKEGNAWQVVFDGNGSIDCVTMRQKYGFPDEILKPGFCN
jgi:hypothetical protein